MRLLFTFLCLITIGCSSMQGRLIWRARELALVPHSMIDLQRPNGETAASINTQTIQRLMLAHIRITRSANVQAELIIYDGEEPNAFASLADGRRVIGINTAMIKLIGDDINEFAALLGHETAHWQKGMWDQHARQLSRRWARFSASVWEPPACLAPDTSLVLALTSSTPPTAAMMSGMGRFNILDAGES